MQELDQFITHNGSANLLWMRLVCLFLWATVAVCLLPGLGRYFQKNDPRICDEWRVALFATGLVMGSNYLVRVFNHGEEAPLIALNATTAALAVYILILIGQGRLK
jgi:TRAP-type C4-dicarboxylate transport system permease small subunit